MIQVFKEKRCVFWFPCLRIFISSLSLSNSLFFSFTPSSFSLSFSSTQTPSLSVYIIPFSLSCSLYRYKYVIHIHSYMSFSVCVSILPSTNIYRCRRLQYKYKIVTHYLPCRYHYLSFIYLRKILDILFAY